MLSDSNFMLGILTLSILILSCLSVIYFSEKRIYSSSSKTFSRVLIYLLLTLIFDYLTYAIDFYDILKTKIAVNIIMWGYLILTLATLNGTANYCYLKTFARTKKFSKKALIITSLPSIGSIIYYIYLYSKHILFFDNGSFIAINRNITFVISADYLVYGLLILILMLTNKKERIIKLAIITDIVIALQIAIIFYIATNYKVFTASIFLTLDMIVLFITVQYPKNWVNFEFNCFDGKALDLVLEDYDIHKKNYYLMTVEIVNFKYYQAKYGVEFTTQMLHKLHSQMPKDTDKTNTYIYFSDIFITLTKDSSNFQKMLEYAQSHLNDTWYINGIKLDLSFQISHYYRDYSRDKENSFIFLDRIVNFLRRDIKQEIVCINETKEFMNREDLVINAIKEAINNNSLNIFIQPIYNVRLNKFDKGEVLVRLIDPAIGSIPPDEFIVLAEKMHFIKDITHQVIQKTVQFLADSEITKYGIQNLNINLSTVDLCNTNITNYLSQQLKNYGLEPSLLTLEVTETAEIESEKIISDRINSFHSEGFQIALDDYGTGYSNMGRILSMPFDYIKIDKDLLNLSAKNKTNEILLRKNIEMLKECGYKIVVEGVEQEDQFQNLKKLGVDYIQGYYFCRPLTTEDFINFMAEHS